MKYVVIDLVRYHTYGVFHLKGEANEFRLKAEEETGNPHIMISLSRPQDIKFKQRINHETPK